MQETLQRLAAERPRKEEELEEIKERIQQLTQKKVRFIRATTYL